MVVTLSHCVSAAAPSARLSLRRPRQPLLQPRPHAAATTPLQILANQRNRRIRSCTRVSAHAATESR
jgi:hypothetical protein